MGEALVHDGGVALGEGQNDEVEHVFFEDWVSLVGDDGLIGDTGHQTVDGGRYGAGGLEYEREEEGVFGTAHVGVLFGFDCVTD